MVTSWEPRGRGGWRGVDRLAFAFDDERVVANAGLVLASTLVERLGIERIVDETLDLGVQPGAARPGRKLLTLVSSQPGRNCRQPASPTPAHTRHRSRLPSRRQARARHAPAQPRAPPGGHGQQTTPQPQPHPADTPRSALRGPGTARKAEPRSAHPPRCANSQNRRPLPCACSRRQPVATGGKTRINTDHTHPASVELKPDEG
jgi:hypothetical protein